MDQSIQGLMKFLKRSVSPYHGVAATIEILKAEGFEELSMYGKWRILPQGKYYVNCRGSMAIAFTVGKTFSPRGAFALRPATWTGPASISSRTRRLSRAGA